MARVTLKMPDEMIEQINKLGERTDAVMDTVLQAGAEVVEKQVRSNLSAVVGSDTKYRSRSTGELERSLGITPVRVDDNGNYDVKIGFAEGRSDGKSNAMLASILEYGKHGQPPKPFMKPAQTKSKAEAVQAMISAFDREVRDL